MPPVGFSYPDRTYTVGLARYVSTDPLRASVGAYAYSADPLEHPDYSGDAPVGATPAAFMAELYSADASGEDLSKLPTISEASHESSSLTRPAAQFNRPPTVSTAPRPSPLARRYMSDYSVIHAKAAAAVEDLLSNLRGSQFTVSDRYLRQMAGHEPIDSVEAVIGDSPDGSREARNRRPRRRARRPVDLRRLVLQKTVGLPTIDRGGLDRPGDAWRSVEQEATRREAIVNAPPSPWRVAGASFLGVGVFISVGYLIMQQFGLL